MKLGLQTMCQFFGPPCILFYVSGLFAVVFLPLSATDI